MCFGSTYLRLNIVLAIFSFYAFLYSLERASKFISSISLFYLFMNGVTDNLLGRYTRLLLLLLTLGNELLEVCRLLSLLMSPTMIAAFPQNFYSSLDDELGGYRKATCEIFWLRPPFFVLDFFKWNACSLRTPVLNLLISSLSGGIIELPILVPKVFRITSWSLSNI